VYLLSGLLVAPDGSPWSGEWSGGQGAYRLGKGRRVSARALDGAVLDAVFADLASPDVAAQIAERMRAQAAPQDRPRDLARLRSRSAALAAKITRLVGLIAEDADAAPAYRRAVADMEQERAAIEAELHDAEAAAQHAQIVRMWTAADVGRLLTTLHESIEYDRDAGHTRDLRATLADLIERVVFDPDTRVAEIRYRLDTGVRMASPRGRPVAPVAWSRVVQIPRRVGAGH
jgi:hypothetical protein